jgi:Tfp pilus assembly protein PilF
MKAIRLDPGYFEAYGNLASAYGRQDRLDMAAALFEDAIKRFPEDPRPYYGLGVACAKMRLYKEAEGYFRHALSLNPADADARRALALMRKRMRAGEGLAADEDSLLRTAPNP